MTFKSVDELVDLITHEPKVGGFLGVSQAQEEKNRAKIRQRLEELRQSVSKPVASEPERRREKER